MWNRAELLQALEGQSENQQGFQLNSQDPVSEVIIDSRRLTKNGLFIALKGENNDGHDYLGQAFEKGCIAAIVERIPENFAQNNLNLVQNLLVVKNSYLALNALALFSRARSKAKIMAITGSVGKTSTKEMLKIAFESQGKTFATSGNFNNHIGLPLSLCNFAADCEFGIFEIGMNHLNEIDPLVKMLRPHLSAITTVGPVHIEFFKNEQEIALAKSEIFHGLSADGIAVINADNQHFEFLKNEAKKCRISDENLISFGNSDKGGCQHHLQLLGSEIISANSSKVSVKMPNGDIKFYEFGSTSEAQILNSMIAVISLSKFAKNFEAGLTSLKNFHQTGGRGAVIEVEISGKKISIIDDTYNASILSVKAGLIHAQNLQKILQKKRLVCALGDMLELGEKSPEIHSQAVSLMNETKCGLGILVGKRMSEALASLKSSNQQHIQSFADSTVAAAQIVELLEDGDLIYIKGSRGTKMEKLIESITPHTTKAH